MQFWAYSKTMTWDLVTGHQKQEPSKRLLLRLGSLKPLTQRPEPKIPGSGIIMHISLFSQCSAIGACVKKVSLFQFFPYHHGVV